MSIAWEAAGGTDVGRVRAGNEDAFRIDAARGVFLVADGMGGHAAGEVASAIAADAALELLRAALDDGVRDDDLLPVLEALGPEAHARLVRHCREHPRTRGMGTTLTVYVLSPDGGWRGAHIGDSRLYRLRDGRFEQITHDHTWVQREVDEGRLAAGAAAKHPLSHILTRVLTDDLAAEVDLPAGTARPGDLYLLATDGLYNMVDDVTIAGIVDADAALTERVAALIRAANRAGGADNVTAILVRVVEG